MTYEQACEMVPGLSRAEYDRASSAYYARWGHLSSWCAVAKPYLPPLILVTNAATVCRHDTPAKASRDAHRWLRRSLAEPGEWATILDSATGEVKRRYVLRGGRVERMQ